MRVLIFGTFDHFHPGHAFVISEAIKRACPPESARGGRRRGDVTVIVARDRNVERIKGKTSDQSETERAETVKKAFSEVTVVLGDPKDFLKPVREIAPDLILLGYDQKLPPGVKESDFACPVERLPAYRPEEFKSSLRRKESEKSEESEESEDQMS